MRAAIYTAILTFVSMFPFLAHAQSGVEITFKSHPSGASVIVDGEVVCWETPCTKSMSGGKHRIIMQIDYYKPMYKDMTFNRGGKISWKLKPDFGLLTVTTKPTGAELRVNGLMVGVSPLKRFKLYPGRYEVTLGSSCDEQKKRNVTISLLRTSRIKDKLRLRRAKLKVATKNTDGKAIDADVIVDGDNIGRSPGDFDVSVCANELSLEYAEHKPFSTKLDLKEGETRSIDVILEPASAGLSEEIHRVGLGSSPGRGNVKDALVTIVEFSDYECPHCGKADETMDKIMENHGDKLRFYYRNFPLPFHEHSMSAAKAALAARSQGKYWEMHHLLYANRENLAYEDLVKYAEQLGLEAQKFQMDMMDMNLEDEIFADMRAAKKLGLRGTPTFYINGRSMMGAIPYPAMYEAIKKAIKDAEKLGLTGDDLYHELTRDAINADK